MHLVGYQLWRRRQSEHILKHGWPYWNLYSLWLATDCARDQIFRWNLTTNPLNTHPQKVKYWLQILLFSITAVLFFELQCHYCTFCLRIWHPAFYLPCKLPY